MFLESNLPAQVATNVTWLWTSQIRWSDGWNLKVAKTQQWHNLTCVTHVWQFGGNIYYSWWKMTIFVPLCRCPNPTWRAHYVAHSPTEKHSTWFWESEPEKSEQQSRPGRQSWHFNNQTKAVCVLSVRTPVCKHMQLEWLTSLRLHGTSLL